MSDNLAACGTRTLIDVGLAHTLNDTYLSNESKTVHAKAANAIAMIALVLESPVIIIIIPGYAASRIRSVYSTAGSDTTIAAVFWRIMQD